VRAVAQTKGIAKQATHLHVPVCCLTVLLSTVLLVAYKTYKSLKLLLFSRGGARHQWQ